MKPHFKLNVKFCPCCGMNHIQPDSLIFNAPQHRGLPDGDYEFICQLCGFGFRITRSNRTRFADMIFKESRRARTMKWPTTEEVGTEMATKMLKALANPVKVEVKHD